MPDPLGDEAVALLPERSVLPVVRRMLVQLGADPDGDLDAAVAHVSAQHATLGDDLPSLLAMTLAPTRLEGSSARNVMPARATVDVDCRLLPGQTQDDLERELRRALGDDLPYELAYPEPICGGTISGIDTPLYAACESFLAEHDPDATLLPAIRRASSTPTSCARAGARSATASGRPAGRRST